jgi:hypothetical protein
MKEEQAPIIPRIAQGLRSAPVHKLVPKGMEHQNLMGEIELKALFVKRASTIHAENEAHEAYDSDLQEQALTGGKSKA